MKKWILLLIMTFVLIFSAAAAWAAIMDIKFTGVSSWKNVDGYKAGVYNIESHTESFGSFCLEFDQEAPPLNVFKPYDMVDPTGDKYGHIVWVYDDFLSLPSYSSEMAATYQAAIWTIDDPTLNFINDSDVIDSLYTSLVATDERLFEGYTILSNICYQDFVKPNPVPLPASIWLLGSGLLVMATGFRKKIGKK